MILILLRPMHRNLRLPGTGHALRHAVR